MDGIKLQCTPIQGGDGMGVGPGKAAVKKKYDFFCFEHGINTSHGHKLDGTLYVPCKNPGPNYDATATFHNPKGGNTKRNDKAGKFWVGVPGGRGGRVVDS